YNEALQNELRAVRPSAVSSLSPEQASQTYTLKEIVLGRQTGGLDDDGKPGDEALQVGLEPRDPDGHAIKAPGSVRVEALQVSPEGLKTPLCFWDIPAAQLRRTWRSGLFSTGYYLVLPWKVEPTSSKLRITARFTLADGRVFEADKDVSIRLPPEGLRKSGPILVMPENGVIVLPPETAVPLPPPRPVPPEKSDDQSAANRPLETTGALKPASWQRSATIP